MKQIILNVPDNKYSFFMELVKNLGFVKVQKEGELSESQLEFIKGIKKSLKQAEKHLKGDITLKIADQLYNEL